MVAERVNLAFDRLQLVESDRHFLALDLKADPFVEAVFRDERLLRLRFTGVRRVLFDVKEFLFAAL